MKNVIKTIFNIEEIKSTTSLVDFDNGFINEKHIIKDRHNISEKEPVYVMFSNVITIGKSFFEKGNNYKCSTCIREGGISFYCTNIKDASPAYGAISWDNIKKVECGLLKDGELNASNRLVYTINNDPLITQLYDCIVLRFYLGKGYDGHYFAVPLAYFIGDAKDSLLKPNIIERIMNDVIVKRRDALRERKEREELEFEEKLNNAYQNNPQEYLDIVDEYNLWEEDKELFRIVHSLCALGRIAEAEDKLSYIEEAYGKGYTYEEIRSIIYRWKGDAYREAEALKLAKDYGTSENILSQQHIQYYNEKSEDAYQRYIQQFEAIPYRERRVISITTTNNLLKTDNLTLLKMSALPQYIKFPITHPKKDHTYICHPHDNSRYLPIEDYDMELLNDRVNEYCYIMQCLGATHIQIKNRKGESLSEHRNKNANYRANGSYKVVGASGNYAESTNNGEESQSRFSFAKEQTFNPTKKPFIPENLLWFPHEVAWQRLAKQRLDGAILQHSEMVSSSQNKVLSHSEMRDINADLNILFVELGGGRKTEEDYTISMNEEVEWEISVKFKPIEDFDNISNTDFTSIAETIHVEEVVPSNEEQFIEEIKHALEDDGVICDKESQYLERMRQRLNISEDKGKELLNKVISSYHKDSNQFSEEEKQYIEEVRYMLEDDDQIDEKENQVLQRFRDRLGISESRAEELKNSIILSWKKEDNLTDEEKEYLKDYEMFIRDGEIQERERRMLNRLAGLLGISEDRAMELERNYSS